MGWGRSFTLTTPPTRRDAPGERKHNMYNMMIHRGECKDFDTIQSCIDTMRKSGFKVRKVYFDENGIVFSKKISIDENGNAKVGIKMAENK